MCRAVSQQLHRPALSLTIIPWGQFNCLTCSGPVWFSDSWSHHYGGYLFLYKIVGKTTFKGVLDIGKVFCGFLLPLLLKGLRSSLSWRENTQPHVETLRAATKAAKANCVGFDSLVSKALASMGSPTPAFQGVWLGDSSGNFPLFCPYFKSSTLWKLKRVRQAAGEDKDTFARCRVVLYSPPSPLNAESAVWLITPEREADALQLEYFGNHVYRG